MGQAAAPCYRQSVLTGSLGRNQRVSGGAPLGHVCGVPEEGDETVLRELESLPSFTSRRSSSMFDRGYLAAIPPDVRRGSILGFGPGAVPVLQVRWTRHETFGVRDRCSSSPLIRQVVVATSAAVRLPAPGTDFHHATAQLFHKDMPRPIPKARWDSNDARHLFLGNKTPVRFGSLMTGATLFCFAGRMNAVF